MSIHANKELQSFYTHKKYKISGLEEVCHTVIVSFSQSTDHEKLMKLLIGRMKKNHLSLLHKVNAFSCSIRNHGGPDISNSSLL